MASTPVDQNDGKSPFKNKTAIIFGSARNLGRAFALEFAKRGARVVAADLDGAGAAETAKLIADAGGKSAAVTCDVMNSESARNAAAEAERLVGDIDIVMNNAGLLHSGNPEDFPLSEWERMFSCNFFGIVRSNEVFLPKMLSRGHGYLVNTASFAGLYPYATNRIPYAASKAAIVSLSENLAAYLLPKGIRVSCLCPGPVMSTSANTMKSFSKDAIMRGPGSQLHVKTPEQAAVILADGMTAGKILIPTHEEGWEIIQRLAASPDDFIREKIDAFARGDSGMPKH